VSSGDFDGPAIVPLSGPGAPEWIPIPAAAALLRCSPRSIERHVKAGRIESRDEPRLGKRAERFVLRRDVEALLPRAFISPSPAAAVPADELAVRGQILSALVRALEPGAIAPAAPPPDPLFVSVDRASAITGLSRRFLRRLISDGVLSSTLDGRRVRVRRRDLEKL
jgi:excisionase family DNA binding protein